MYLQKQPNNWSCFPTALAMCLDLPIEKIIETIGHDGGSILWTTPEPYNRRTFHSAEIILAAWKLGYATTAFEVNPTIGWPNGDRLDLPPLNVSFLKTQLGIMTGVTLSGQSHAVAWNPEKQCIFDPNYSMYSWEKFTINEFFAITRR